MTLEQTNAAVARKALEYVDKLLKDHHKIVNSPEFKSVFTIAAIHGCGYAGEQFDAELLKSAQEFVDNHKEYYGS